MAIEDSVQTDISGPTSNSSNAPPSSAPCPTTPSDTARAPSAGAYFDVLTMQPAADWVRALPLPRHRAFQPVRELTVTYLDGRPMLRLLGLWLDDAGFSTGTKVRVDVSNRRLVVEAIGPEPLRVCESSDCPHEAKSANRRAAAKRKAQQQ